MSTAPRPFSSLAITAAGACRESWAISACRRRSSSAISPGISGPPPSPASWRDALDAFAISQIYSRLVIDSNRDPSVESSIVTLSELTEIPGNRDLSPAERAARAREILEPYHQRIEAELDRRQAAGRPTVLIAMHSFTPVFKGVAAALADRRALSTAMLASPMR